jgi:outer membrane receptor protein involved in Fe transport
MQIRVLLPTILIALAFAMAPSTVLAQGTPQEPEQVEADSNAEGSAPDGSEAESNTADETDREEKAAEEEDEDFDSVYEDDDDPGGIEVITVRAEESEAASDFESGDSVAAFDASDLEALGAQSIADLATFTPNLEIVTSGATTPTFFIRGVGLNDFNANSSGAVAIYQNDVPKNSPALQLGTLFDIENVNVLRGPQGSGTFRSASAGAIKIYSKTPTGDYNGYFRSTVGNYNAIDLEGAVGGPVFEDILAGRIAFRYSDRDGYGKNGCGDSTPQEDRVPYPGGGLSTAPPWSQCGEDVKTQGVNGSLDGKSTVPDDLPSRVNDQHNWAARGTLRFQPTLDQEWLLTATGGKRDELSRLGQSIGANQDREYQSFLGPLGDDGQRGLLGTEDSGPYTPREVDQELWEIDPCRNDDDGSNRCFLPGTTDRDKPKADYSRDASRRLLAENLARRLDSRPYHGDYDKVGPTELETWGVSLKGDIVLADNVELTSVTGYDHYDRFIGLDLDQSPNQLFETDTDDDGWQFAQTLQIDGGVGQDIPVTWHFGGLFLYEELNVGVANTFSGQGATAGAISDRFYKQKLWSGTMNGGFTFNFWEKFALDAGVRYNWERKSINYLLLRGNTFDFPLYSRETWQAPTGSIRLTYNFTENTYSYWKYTRGWKGGHFNATGGDDGVTNADPESIDAFEIWLHGMWYSGVLIMDFSFFHYNYHDYQLFTSIQNFGVPPEFIVLNAANSEVYGSELDIALRPLPGMKLQARLAWLQTQFLDYTQVQVAERSFGQGNNVVANNEIQNSGNPLLNSPQFKVSLTAEQSVPLGRMGKLTARWDGAWTDDTNYDAQNARGVPNFDGEQFLPKNTIGQRAYWIHNLNLTYSVPSGGVQITGWVRNLEDKVYKNFAFDASTFAKTTVYYVGEPRTYGVSLTASF